MSDSEPTVNVTARYLLDHGLWARACEVTGLSEWAVNEGRMDSGEEVKLTAAQAAGIGLLAVLAKSPPEDRPLEVGDVLYGFCGGCFGRDSYSDKRVEAIGADWVVARHDDDGGVAFYGGDPARLREYRQRPDSVMW